MLSKINLLQHSKFLTFSEIKQIIHAHLAQAYLEFQLLQDARKSERMEEIVEYLSEITRLPITKTDIKNNIEAIINLIGNDSITLFSEMLKIANEKNTEMALCKLALHVARSQYTARVSGSTIRNADKVNAEVPIVFPIATALGSPQVYDYLKPHLQKNLNHSEMNKYFKLVFSFKEEVLSKCVQKLEFAEYVINWSKLFDEFKSQVNQVRESARASFKPFPKNVAAKAMQEIEVQLVDLPIAKAKSIQHL